jgi:hypothetical protein
MGNLRSAVDDLAADDLQAMPTSEVMDRLRDGLVRDAAVTRVAEGLVLPT